MPAAPGGDPAGTLGQQQQGVACSAFTCLTLPDYKHTPTAQAAGQQMPPCRCHPPTGGCRLDTAHCAATTQHLKPAAAWCAAAGGAGGSSGSNFTDFIEFQHSDDESGGEAEELLHPNGTSGAHQHAAGGQDWTWGKLLKDIWKVNHNLYQQQGAAAGGSRLCWWQPVCCLGRCSASERRQAGRQLPQLSWSSCCLAPPEV